jgi:valyl-tRNA synthetase
VDTAFDAGQMQVGRRLAIKLLNASKFVLGKTEPAGSVTNKLDQDMLVRLFGVEREVTAHLDGYDYSSALREIESFFWWFCDDYIELVKRRRATDSDDAASATAACLKALNVMLRLFAPFVPFVTEEVWSWWQDGSIHSAAWPADAVTQPPVAHVTLTGLASEITAEIRRARSASKLAFGVAVERLQLPERHRDLWSEVAGDVLAGNNAATAQVTFGDEFAIEFAPLARP